MVVAIDVQMDTTALDKLTGTVVDRLTRRREYLGLVGQRYLAWIDENFRSAGAEQPWKPLSPNTIAGRRTGRGAGSAQPLRDTGRMAQSFVSLVESDSVWVGTKDQKAEYHHFGTPARRITTSPPGRKARSGKRPGALRFMTPKGPVFRREVRHPGIPARPLLPSLGLATRMAEEVMSAYLEQAVKDGEAR